MTFFHFWGSENRGAVQKKKIRMNAGKFVKNLDLNG
jgi:hypothetical protein